MGEPEPVLAYIGFGSNLGDRQNHLEAALEALGRLPKSELLERSPIYHSAPMGPRDQPDYLNAVAVLHTSLTPLALLEGLQAVEAARGRERGPVRWGPRVLDLDLLLYGDRRIDSARLTVPHPGLTERNFVLIPLFDVAPDLVLPDKRRLADVVSGCSRKGLRRHGD